jgi:hypothetical protein
VFQTTIVLLDDSLAGMAERGLFSGKASMERRITPF